MYIYRCGDLQWPGGATIGYNGGPVGNFFENHPLSGSSANSIACINTGVTEFSNVVYNVSIDVYIPTDTPPTVEPRKTINHGQCYDLVWLTFSVHMFLYLLTAQDIYLEFLERTNNSITMPRCDDCVSNAIDLSSNPVPFGDPLHYVAHVRGLGAYCDFRHFSLTPVFMKYLPLLFISKD